MRRVGVFIIGRNGHRTFHADQPGERIDGPALARYLHRHVTGGPFTSRVAYERNPKELK